MDKAQRESVFTQQSASYDEQWAKLSAIRDGLLLLVAARFSGLPRQARILCAGTGAEVQFPAERYPGWPFMACFDIAVGMGLMRKPWAKVWPAIDPRTGNFLLFGLLALAGMPLIIWPARVS